MRAPFFLIAALSFLISACSEPVTRAQVSPIPQPEEPRILAMGDSMMAWHNVSERSIADVVGRELGEPVENYAVSGARVLYKLPVSGAMGMEISKQYRPGNWDWVVLNGGGNDLWMGCGCGECHDKLNRMITLNGRGGEIAKTVVNLRKTGAQVVYVGYMRSPGRGSIIDHCGEVAMEMEDRIAKLAAQVEGVHFVSLTDMIPYGDLSYHGVDRIHPSLKGSREIGRRVAEVIRSVEVDG